MKTDKILTDTVKLKKIRRLINSFYKAEEKDGCWDNRTYAANAVALIDQIYKEVTDKITR